MGVQNIAAHFGNSGMVVVDMPVVFYVDGNDWDTRNRVPFFVDDDDKIRKIKIVKIKFKIKI